MSKFDIKESLTAYFNSFPDFLMRYVEEVVPMDMRNGEVDEEGWIDWKIVNSTITMEEIEVIEQQYEIIYPELYKQFLMAYHYVELQFKNIKEGSSYKGDCAFIEMPRLLTGEGLSEVISLIENWHPMLLAGYLPFAVAEDGQGPICFDLQSPNEQGDYPVVWVLHDYLHQLVDAQQDGEAIRTFLQPYIKEIFPSFEEMARFVIVPMKPFKHNDE
jgi:hypothetical protein